MVSAIGKIEKTTQPPGGAWQNMNIDGQVFFALKGTSEAGGEGVYLSPYPVNSRIRFGNLEFLAMRLADRTESPLHAGAPFRYQGRVELRFSTSGERYLQALDYAANKPEPKHPSLDLIHDDFQGKAVRELSPHLKRFHSLLGEWSGSGSIMTANQTKETFQQTEKVAPAADGNSILIEGRGVSTTTGKVVHSASGKLWWSDETKQYILSTKSPGGEPVDAPVTMNGSELSWLLPSPSGGRIRFVISHKNDEWIEHGYFTPPNVEREFPFFEMTLRRAATSSK